MLRTDALLAGAALAMTSFAPATASVSAMTLDTSPCSTPC